MFIIVLYCTCILHDTLLIIFFFRFSELTYSLWGQVWARLEDFMNPLFGTDNQQVFLNISTEVPSLS